MPGQALGLVVVLEVGTAGIVQNGTRHWKLLFRCPPRPSPGCPSCRGTSAPSYTASVGILADARCETKEGPDRDAAGSNPRLRLESYLGSGTSSQQLLAIFMS